MPPDNQRQDAATSSDLSRPVATSSDSKYSLSVEDALARYTVAGIPRTVRSIQRYYANYSLDCHRDDTPFGTKFLIDPASVDRHIAYINEMERRPVVTGRDLSRQVATLVAAENKDEEPVPIPATSNDSPRPPATETSVSPPVAADQRIMELLERENAFLREQVKIKDQQIADQTERSRETNVLFNGLQRMLSPLLGSPDPNRSPHHPDDRYRPDEQL